MPRIKDSVVFDVAELQLIRSKLEDPDFIHSQWSADDLTAIRSKIRDHYRKKQKGKCAYCNGPVSLVSASNAHVEHIAPKSLYPNFIFEPKNLCVVCADCNEIKKSQETLNDIPDTVKKGDERKRYPRSSQAFKIVHPFFDEYGEHIKQFGSLYTHRTTKGRFTIYACNLNRYLEKLDITEDFIFGVFSSMMTEFMNTSDSSLERGEILKQIKDMFNMCECG